MRYPVWKRSSATSRASSHIRTTTFQWRVWEELRAIPHGQTRSYSEVARAIGQPTARRAVAQACKQNPISLIILCHRVVRDDGSLGGYRWGADANSACLKPKTA